jgi:hypothetical protein
MGKVLARVIALMMIILVLLSSMPVGVSVTDDSSQTVNLQSDPAVVRT